jgi:acyl-CoA dehydrogenase
MGASYDAEHQNFIQSVRRVLDEKIRPHINAWENAGNYPDEVYRILGEQGFLGILIPEEYGGIGGDYKLAGAWCEAFGELPAVGMTVGVNMHSLVVSHSLEKYGSPALKQTWLPKAATGEAIGAYAFTEPGAGSDLASLRTKAVKDGSRWIINGSKTFITNGARAHFILVLTRTDFEAGYNGFTTFLVDTRSPGFKINKKLDKLGWRSSDTAEMTFENVVVDEGCVIGNVGDGWIQASNNLNWERMMLVLTTLGGMRACYHDTVRYSRDRRAFGKAIGDFDSINAMLEGMYTRIVLGEALCRHALELLNSGRPCRAEVSAAKRLVCEDALWLCDQAIQIHGGYGYTTEFSPERWWRDLRLMPIGGGTSEIMAGIVAKELKLG